MRIGIDARNLVSPLSGISRYIIETTRHLAALGGEIYLYLPESTPAQESLPPSVKLDISTFRGALPRIVWGNVFLPKLLQRDKIDVFWGPAHRLPLISAPNIPTVVTIHDLVWHHAPSTMRLKGWLAERAFMGSAIRRATEIVAVSHTTREDICALYPATRDKISVVWPGCTRLPAPAVAAVYPGLSQPYMLFVGTLEPRKNLVNLLRAYALLPDAVRAGWQLVIAGGQGWKLDHLESIIAELNITQNVLLTGFVSDAELGALYANAEFLVMPSFYEGFGLPIIEANAAGIPALTSCLSSMPEVGGDAALLVDPESPESISNGLKSMMTDKELYQTLSAATKTNAARFTWENSAKELVGVFEQAARKRAFSQ
jgi:glycosyltransferase involved in cell wall biosynthesis